ncbi:hypothetical protein KIN20_008380 [Parelaphostrongylus tenuis]|uniref:Uncharacterized protein n=1 Tax=Parelaphostrongylus tenuis TaxID=148309 RepID=A0AAD5QJT1_PARTN|nr:hypothetical protein KIN20_008380 [Parelaphostrongylus tenuis]
MKSNTTSEEYFSHDNASEPLFTSSDEVDLMVSSHGFESVFIGEVQDNYVIPFNN